MTRDPDTIDHAKFQRLKLELAALEGQARSLGDARDELRAERDRLLLVTLSGSRKVGEFNPRDCSLAELAATPRDVLVAAMVDPGSVTSAAELGPQLQWYAERQAEVAQRLAPLRKLVRRLDKFVNPPAEHIAAPELPGGR